ncbi:unnamed protein product [Thelazia callipaeda]|uniref:Uncharacterized protein n=1 Tax=Thelazia callipaeda TaxID=103827 RepID=A0A0N5DAD5_THECL|nr:unnamed protein product [Thelazia callipaeda]
MNENNGKTDAVGKRHVKGVREHATNLPELGTSKMITLEALVRRIEISKSREASGQERCCKRSLTDLEECREGDGIVSFLV